MAAPPPSAGGIDSIVLAFHANWPRDARDIFIAMCSARRGQTVQFGDFDFVVRARRHGWDQHNAPIYLERGGVTFGFCPASGAHYPALVVQGRGGPCTRYGVDLIREWAISALRGSGAAPVREVIREIDLRLDLPGQSIDPFLAAHKAERFVALADFNTSGRSRCNQGWSIRFGTRKSPISLSIYDKLAETSDSPTKRELTRRRCWGGVVPAQAIRVEYRVKGKALVKFGIGSLADFQRHRRRLINYLVHDPSSTVA